MGDLDRIATTGFSKMSDRQVSLWEASSLTNIKTTTIDQSSGVLMPFWSDNNILFLGTSFSLPLSPFISSNLPLRTTAGKGYAFPPPTFSTQTH